MWLQDFANEDAKKSIDLPWKNWEPITWICT